MERQERNLSEVNCVVGVFAKPPRRKVGRDQQVKKDGFERGQTNDETQESRRGDGE